MRPGFCYWLINFDSSAWCPSANWSLKWAVCMRWIFLRDTHTKGGWCSSTTSLYLWAPSVPQPGLLPFRFCGSLRRLNLALPAFTVDVTVYTILSLSCCSQSFLHELFTAHHAAWWHDQNASCKYHLEGSFALRCCTICGCWGVVCWSVRAYACCDS